MDSALELRIKIDGGVKISTREAFDFLSRSLLVKKLTSDTSDRTLFYVWRLLALSEIPYSENLPYTKALLRKIFSTMGTESGFSITGKAEDLLPCYNAMVSYALCRLLEKSALLRRGG